MMFAGVATCAFDAALVDELLGSQWRPCLAFMAQLPVTPHRMTLLDMIRDSAVLVDMAHRMLQPQAGAIFCL